MNSLIYVFDDSGNEIDLSQYGLTCISFIPESLSPNFESDSMDDTDGSIPLGTTISDRTLYAKFYFQAADHIDYQLLRDEIFRLFNPKKVLYIIDTRQQGKRWKVRVSNTFKPEYINPIVGQFEIEFIAYDVYCESLGTTLDPLTFDAELWQIGQGMNDADKKYIQTTPTFSIFNAGDIIIDPRRYPITITYTGASSNLQITNNTTGDAWSFTGTLAASDSIVLDGVRATKNGLSIFRDTNHKLITLAPGWNDFVLSGTSGSFQISFDFRHYYI